MENCTNCDAKITSATAFRIENQPVSQETLDFVNTVLNERYPSLCGKCGRAPEAQAVVAIENAISERKAFIEANVINFPMFTLSWLPATVSIKYKNLITANVTVGTGFFSELSQQFSDFTGAVNLVSGMSYKVNKGESAARLLLVQKALALGANCIVGVDIDYGTTTNNAATINMQGTAATIANLDVLLDADDMRKAQELHDALDRLGQLYRWKQRDMTA